MKTRKQKDRKGCLRKLRFSKIRVTGVRLEKIWTRAFQAGANSANARAWLV